MTNQYNNILEDRVGVRKLDIAINVNKVLSISTTIFIGTGSSSTIVTS